MTGQPIAILDGGTYYHHFAFADPMVADRVDTVVTLRGLRPAQLAGFGTVIVACRSNPDLLAEAAEALIGVLRRGDRLVVLGENEPTGWLPGVRETGVPTNYWWWLDPAADLGLTLRTPDHPLFRYVDLQSATWHYHGRFDLPQGAVGLIDCVEGGPILYEDRVSWPGTLLVTSLDPIYHHGSFFMPAASRFLDGLMAWLRASADEPCA